MNKENLLGAKAKDIVGGTIGIVTAYAKWLNGCNRVLITTAAKKSNETPGELWVDVIQVKVLEERAKELKDYAPLIESVTERPPAGGRPSPARYSEVKR